MRSVNYVNFYLGAIHKSHQDFMTLLTPAACYTAWSLFKICDQRDIKQFYVYGHITELKQQF